MEIAGKCGFGISDVRPRLPAFTVPGGRDSHEFLRGLVEQGARERYGDPPGEPENRQIEHELTIIRRLGLADYFLIMWDIVRFARREGILVQGRGSAANSAVCYCLGITAVDPVGLDLLFERFLSESRQEPPDIDLDIAHSERERVLQYVYERYGRGHAAMVCESITWRGRMAVRDAARVLGLPQESSDRLAAEVDRGGSGDAVRRLVEGGSRRPGSIPVISVRGRYCRIVQGLEDLPRHRSIHVGGFVLSDRPIGEIVPVERASMPDRTIIQWDKDDLDLPGFIKFDLLGLGMLTMLSDGLRLVRESRGTVLDLASLPPDDPEVYDMICAADTVGVFQIESRAQMNTLPRVRPRCFYDLVIEVALIRPGPIQGDMVHPYLRRRRGEEPVTYLDPRLEPLLDRTLGVPLFQEQGMKVAIVLAGFSTGPGRQHASRDGVQALTPEDAGGGAGPDRRSRGERSRFRCRRQGAPVPHRVRQLRLPGKPFGQLRAAGVRLGVPETLVRAGVHLRSSQRSADGLLFAGDDHPRCEAARSGGATDRPRDLRLELHAGKGGGEGGGESFRELAFAGRTILAPGLASSCRNGRKWKARVGGAPERTFLAQR